MGRRILNDALRTIVNAERRGKASVELKPISTVMKEKGRVNDCKALTYRQDVRAKEIEKYTERTLPTRQWGYVVMTTPDEILDHEEAIKRNVGGQVLGFFY